MADGLGGPFDAAIIGGGPAGCSAAISLAALGARPVLFEAQPYPHDKLCGEFLSPEVAGLLDSFGLTPAVGALGPAVIEVACLTAPNGAAWETRLPGLAWGLTRRALDAALAARARALGVAVSAGSLVTAVTGSLAEGFTLQFEARGPLSDGRPRRGVVRARTVIAAHGKRAALDRALQRRFLRRPQPFVALKAHVRGLPLPGRIELHAFRGGYCGMSELERSAYGAGASNVCLLAHESVFRAAGAAGPERLPAFLRWMQSQNPRLAERLGRATLLSERWLSVGQVPFDEKSPVEGDALMAGDAAGLIVPLAGDGIAMALRGGQLAAAYCAAYLCGGMSAAGLRRGYAAAWRREFGARVRLGRLLQALMLHPEWFWPALHLLRAVPRLGQYLVAHTRGTGNDGRL